MTAPFKIITVEKVRPLLWAYLDKPGNGAGGSLHIVVEDGNFDDDSAFFCLTYALKKNDMDGVELAAYFFLLTPSQRKKLSRPK